MGEKLPRKQRELVERENLILDTTQNLLHAHGYACLTMDRVAEAVEYSKGTVYNHFSSKEDLVGSLCCRCIRNLIELFERAASYDGRSRECYMAIGIAYSLYYQLHPLDAQNIQVVKSNAVREKLSTAKQEEIQSLEHEITSITKRIVQRAIACGDLPATNQAIADEIVFGCWSMHFGALQLTTSVPLNALGFDGPIQILWRNSHRFLDAFGWKPLSSEIDTDELFQKLSQELFRDEIDKLNNGEK